MNQKQEEQGSNKGVSSKSIKPLGLSVQDVSVQLKEKYNISGGALVTSVDKYSDAFIRGLSEGMVIIEANKKKVNNSDDLTDAVSDKKSGDSVLMKVIDKSGTERIIAVKVQ
jgi:serine protease Do